MAKRLSVLSFLCCIGAASDDIPVTVKEGPKTIGTAKSLWWLELHGSPGVLEARLEYAVIRKQEITLQIRLKDYNTKRP